MENILKLIVRFGDWIIRTWAETSLFFVVIGQVVL